MGGRMHVGLCAAVLLASALFACKKDKDDAPDGGDEGASPQQLAVDGITENVFLPMAAALQASGQALNAQAESFCVEPDGDGLKALQKAWGVARADYKQTEVMGFGPHTLSPWRLASQLDFWPGRPESVDKVLTGDQDLSDPDTELSAAARGLPAIEYLIFAPEHDADWFAAEPRRCAYLLFIAARLSDNALGLRGAWADTFADELRVREGTDRYDNIQDAFGAIVNQLAFVVEIMRDEKLGTPLGLKSGGTPQLDKLESPFAERGIEDLRDNLRGVRAAFLGDFDDHVGPGVDSVLSARADAGSEPFELHWEAAMAALETIDGPLAQAIERDPASIEAAMEALRALQVYLQVDLAQALNVTITFGGADGD